MRLSALMGSPEGPRAGGSIRIGRVDSKTTRDSNRGPCPDVAAGSTRIEKLKLSSRDRNRSLASRVLQLRAAVTIKIAKATARVTTSDPGHFQRVERGTGWTLWRGG
jgi:hypothetical protein